jgi:hypothetical protein
MANNVAKNAGVKLIVGKENIEKEIKSIATTGAKFQERVKVCALSCVEHIKAHGDNTLLLKLLQALPNGLRSQSFIQFCEQFAGVKYINRDENGKTLPPEQHKFKKVGDVKESVTLANGKTVAMVEVDPLNFAKMRETGDVSDYRGFDLLDAIDRLMKQARAAAEHVKKSPGDASKVFAPDDAIASLGEMRNRLEQRKAKAREPKAEIVRKADKPAPKAPARRVNVEAEMGAAKH